MTTICFTLKNTSFRVCIELTDVQYAYFQLLAEQRQKWIPLDQDVLQEMATLLEHVEPEEK